MTDHDHFTISPEPPATATDGVVTSRVRLAGEFDIDTRDDLRAAMLAAVDGVETKRVVVDLSQVRFIDSEAISALIDGYLAAEQAGVSFRMTGTNGIVQRVLTVVGLDYLIDPPEQS